MFVEIRDGVAAVQQATDLKGLSVRVPKSSDQAAWAAALGDLGHVADDGAHVWLHIGAFKATAAATVPAAERADWERSFDGMIAYATSKGWCSDDGTSVRAHVES